MKIIDLCKEEEEDPHMEHPHHKDTDLRSVTRNEIRILQELKGWFHFIVKLNLNFFLQLVFTMLQSCKTLMESENFQVVESFKDTQEIF